MESVIALYKPVGITPLQLIRSFQQTYPIYQEAKLGYAGRLDPMADGVLLVLVGQENKLRKTYEVLPKIYSFDLLFGVATDTYDQLGMITTTSAVSLEAIRKQLPAAITAIREQKRQAYPPYSSRTVQGKPLFWWARHKRLQEIHIPTHTITISDLRLLHIAAIDSEALANRITTTITLATGDFRQHACLHRWHTYFSTHQTPLVVASFHLVCSSGTYVRALCHDIGSLLGVGGIALRITREAAGPYTRSHALRI